MHLWRLGAPNSQNKIPIMLLGPKIIPKYLVEKPPQILQTLLSVGNWSEAELTVITCSATHNPCTLFFRKGLHKHVFYKLLHKFARQLAAVADFCFYKCLTAAENELSLKEGQFHFSSQALIQRQEGGWGTKVEWDHHNVCWSLHQRPVVCCQNTEWLFCGDFLFFGPFNKCFRWIMDTYNVTGADLWPSGDGHMFFAAKALSVSYWQFSAWRGMWGHEESEERHELAPFDKNVLRLSPLFPTCWQTLAMSWFCQKGRAKVKSIFKVQPQKRYVYKSLLWMSKQMEASLKSVKNI